MNNRTFMPRGHLLDLSDKKLKQCPAAKMTPAQREVHVHRIGTVANAMTPADEWLVLFVMPKDGSAAPAVASPDSMGTEALVNALAKLLGHAYTALQKEREAEAERLDNLAEDAREETRAAEAATPR